MNELRDKVKMPAYEYGKLIGKIESLQESLLTAQGQLEELKGCARTALKEYFDGENKNWVEDVRNKMDTLDNLLTQLDKTQK